MIKTMIVFLLLLSGTAVTAQSKDMITGNWLNTTGEAQIQIFASGNKYFGKLIWLKESLNEKGVPKKDRHNPNTELMNRPLI